MKALSTTLAALTLATLSFGSFAATQVSDQPSNSQEIGVISAGQASNLSALEKKLDAKASEAGATSYRITSTTGQNKLHGTAVLYR